MERVLKRELTYKEIPEIFTDAAGKPGIVRKSESREMRKFTKLSGEINLTIKFIFQIHPPRKEKL